MLRAHGLKHLGLALLLVGACSAGKQNAATGIDFDPAGYDGFDETQFKLLAADCSYSNGDMTVTVDEDETAYIFKRADGLVVANASIGSAECTMDPSKKITINSAAPGAAQDEKVIIDFYSGIFGLNSGGTPSLFVALGAGTGDELKIRGTPAVDTVTLGTKDGTSYLAIQAAPANARNLPDLTMTGVEAITVSTGAGNDTITGQAGAALSSVAGMLPVAGSISLSFYGGDGNDTIISGAQSEAPAANSLKGGAGNDYFPQQSALAKDVIAGGADIDTVDYSNRTNPLRVTVGVVTAATAATGSITALAEDSLSDNDYFVLSDGVKTVRFAYQKTANAKATGSITAVAKASLVDGETFTINDGTNAATVFEFDVAGDGVTTGTLVDVSAATDADSVAVIIRAAINGVAGGLTVTALAPVGADVGLEADTADATHNVAITETVADAGFLVSGMTGGSAFVRSGDNATAELIDLSAAGVSTAIQVAAATFTAIDGQHTADTIDITATDPAGTTVIALEADNDGGTANVTILTSAPLADSVTGMSGGTSFDDGESGEGDTIGSDVENVIGGAGADVINASTSAVPHVLMGMGGNDTLTGAGLVDYLYGGLGNDTLVSGAGADFLYGGTGNDALQGGTENDTINGGGVNCVAATSAVVPFVNTAQCTSAVATAPTNPGVDTLDYSDRAEAVTVDLTVANLTCTLGRVIGVAGECDIIVTFGTGAAAAASVRNIRGGSAADSLTGDAQDNMIWGGDGNDTISGAAGNDTLYGEGGNEVAMNGGDGNDYLCGGAGTNALNGDGGLDALDASMGTNDVVDCGAGDGDILLSGTGTTFSAAEGAATSCEL